MKNLMIDIETYSGTDLTKSGVNRYARASDFEVLLFAYSADGGAVSVIDLACGEALPDEIHAALLDDSITKWAFNAQFERTCLSAHLGRQLSPGSWRCDMVWAAYMGLPLSLEGAGIVTGADKQKLAEGKDLIRYFCKPCNPTQVNGGRARNLPWHAPDKWAWFKEYNKRDVETELTIQSKLRKFPLPEWLWEEYVLDQQINDRGIMLDQQLMRQAIRCDELTRRKLTKRMEAITRLENPNSVQQMKDWLAQNGLETDSLDKAAVKELLLTAPPELAEVLRLRQLLAKSSVKKYTAMENAICADGRARGLLQFYGANRTGRFSGRLIQVQNLPQNHMPDLAEARELVRSGQFDTLDSLYDSIPNVLSELIRTAFIPKPGCKFIVADFSAIEARVIAWLAGESWRNEVFAGHGKIYEASASQMFHVPIEEITKGSPLRQKGKQAELACIAEGELVLTDQGLVPIEKVTIAHKVWDGLNWVSHDGVMCNGIQEVTEYDGLRATKNHLVWVEGQPEPIRFGDAADSCACLLQTGDGRQPIRLGRDHISRETLEQKDESLLCVDAVCGVRQHPVAESEQSNQQKIPRMPSMFKATASPTVAGQTPHCRQATVRKSQRPQLCQLRRAGNQMEVRIGAGGRAAYSCAAPGAPAKHGGRQDQHQWPLRTRQYQAGDAGRKSAKPTRCCSDAVGAKVLALFEKCSNTKALQRADARGGHKGCGNIRIRKTKKLAANLGPVRVYDIRNAGQHHRFTVSGKLVHNCGYGGSVGALKAMGALDMGLQEKELKPLVDRWRSANPNIVKLWWAVDNAVKETVRDHKTTATHGIRFTRESGMLFITLPSGRRLAYVKPRMGTNRFGGDSVTYEGVGQAKRWERIESYGPKFVENIVQAISRDILCYAMRALDAAGYRIVMHVHDEVVLEAPLDAGVDAVCALMSETPPWADGLLLRADGYGCPFYQKD